MFIETKQRLELLYLENLNTTNLVVLEPGRYEAERIPSPTSENDDSWLVIRGVHENGDFKGFTAGMTEPSWRNLADTEKDLGITIGD